jgi:hypothetical protein
MKSMVFNALDAKKVTSELSLAIDNEHVVQGLQLHLHDGSQGVIIQLSLAGWSKLFSGVLAPMVKGAVSEGND